MSTYCMLLQYDGSRYNGWQKQGNTSNTIQEKLEGLLERLYGVPVEIAGSGRTDAGVHALGQTASFHIPATADSLSCQALLTSLNQYLPQDIRVLHVVSVKDRFHARLQAVSKTYEYRIDNGPFADVFSRRYAAHIAAPLDLSAMRQASEYLIGTHDFKSFCSNKHMKKSTVRTITSIEIISEIISEQPFLTIRFCGNGFLYHMVRLITGTLIEIGLHQKAPSEMKTILEGQNRALAGYTAPSEGLFLVNVDYPEPL